MFNQIEEAIVDLQLGKIVIVCDDENRENEGDFVLLAEHATPENINFLIKYGRGLVCVPVAEQLSKKLGLSPMVSNNSDIHGTAFTVSVDYKSTTTGISAFERSETILAMIDNQSEANDFKKPGHVFPLIAKNEGVFERPGHTEAAVDLARLAGSTPAGVICEIIKDDGTMARVNDLKKIADKHQLKMITIKDLIQYRMTNEVLVKQEVKINLPTEYGNFQVVGYSNKRNKDEHIAIIKGKIDSNSVPLVRIHKQNLLGDVFGSFNTKSSLYLHSIFGEMEKYESAVLLYLRKEEKEEELIRMLKVYKLQEQGFSTNEVDEKLRLNSDYEDYHMAAQILKDLGIKQMKLLENKRKEVEILKRYDLDIDRMNLHQSNSHIANHLLFKHSIKKQAQLINK
ncbi:3,4-dihydroxy-2-butanone-4-phosphate synthase [Alkalihalobacterium elongatum]|uniref:3,4-dihydroxy-2-butanone-4-phosphate synthase n=1 Tax=Alkalihalobacterium elongatum TaxID=2675466 RepID=UPI001C1F382B|nr:3,4-dihydroxy-2-butanone-4-phosphate synthase [Alkalihalobacterium elongatum]